MKKKKEHFKTISGQKKLINIINKTYENELSIKNKN